MGGVNENENPFSCNMVRLNLPSGGNYTPPNPWISKVSKEGNVDIEAFIYVDDVHSLG